MSEQMELDKKLAQYLGMEFLQVLGTTDMLINLKYLRNLYRGNVVEMEDNIGSKNIRLFKLRRLNYEKGVDVVRCFGSVFSAIARYNSSLIYLLRFDGNYVELYLGVNCEVAGELSMIYDTFQGAFYGNFKSSDESARTLSNKETEELLSNFFDYESEDNISVAAVSGVIESKIQNAEQFIGLERLIDGMNHACFELVILAETLSADTVTKIRDGYEELYNNLTPFRQCTLNISDSNTKSYAESIGQAISRTLTQTSGVTWGISHSSTKTTGHGENETLPTTQNRAVDIGSSLLAVGSMKALLGTGIETSGMALAGALMGGAYLIGPIANLMHAVIGDSKKSESNNFSFSETDTKHKDKTESTAEGTTKTFNLNQTDSDSHTEGRSFQYTYENLSVELLLKTIKQRTASLRYSESNGAFALSAYIIAADNAVTNRVAGLYRSTFAVDAEQKNNIYVNVWDDKENTSRICSALRQMHHPQISLANDVSIISKITPCTIVPVEDLPRFFLLPKNTLPGLTVTEYTQFSREGGFNISYENRLALGNLYHMGSEEDNQIFLDIESLSMHTFLTGTTGSGKSTAIYHILHSLRRKGIPFLVIEPVKGEYKNEFGHFEDVYVFGTNAQYLPLLRIDPFYFPEGIHILEHLDGLTEIFNVCWPMYAAMTDILKNGLERAYKVAGWNLKTSVNKYGIRIFPTFADIMQQIRIILEESDYSNENKGNYIGSLCTRLTSLTNGLGGMIFNSNAIPDEILFDKNVVLDLSRIRSGETKALLMGILILKLQEYRQANASQFNQKLRHVTVLEEAHNLMRTNAVPQSGESSNMIQKSVEMISNAIAEIRTYGEGFIIADQAPEQLDSSAIQNTNTKIVLRLPREDDREIVGKSMGLNSEQIQELAKLPTGVAAVYQNNWMSAVLMKLPSPVGNQKNFLKSDVTTEDINFPTMETLREAIVHNKLATWIQGFGDFSETDGAGVIAFLKLNLNATMKCALLNYSRQDIGTRRQYLRSLAYDYFNAEEVFSMTKSCHDILQWRRNSAELLEPTVSDLNDKELDFLLSLLIWTRYKKDRSYSKLYFDFADYLRSYSDWQNLITKGKE